MRHMPCGEKDTERRGNSERQGKAGLDLPCTREYTRAMAIESFRNQSPQTEEAAFVAASADLIGGVRMQAEASAWYNSTLRADVAPIIIGRGSNVQDNSCLHVDFDVPCVLGEYVTVGHSVTLHACTVEDKCLIGMGAIVLDGAVIGHGSIVGAHALVTKNTIIPPHSLVLGSPARVVRQLGPEVEEENYRHALEYVKLAREYRDR